jgi:hypothetical protein
MERLTEEAMNKVYIYLAECGKTTFDEDDRDLMIQQIFNTTEKFDDLDEVDAFLNGSIHSLSVCIDEYKEYMEDNGFDLDADVIKIMNMCWYIVGSAHSLEYINETLQDIGVSDSDEESDEEIVLEPTQ